MNITEKKHPEGLASRIELSWTEHATAIREYVTQRDVKITGPSSVSFACKKEAPTAMIHVDPSGKVDIAPLSPSGDPFSLVLEKIRQYQHRISMRMDEYNSNEDLLPSLHCSLQKSLLEELAEDVHHLRATNIQKEEVSA